MSRHVAGGVFVVGPLLKENELVPKNYNSIVHSKKEADTLIEKLTKEHGHRWQFVCLEVKDLVVALSVEKNGIFLGIDYFIQGQAKSILSTKRKVPHSSSSATGASTSNTILKPISIHELIPNIQGVLKAIAQKSKVKNTTETSVLPVGTKCVITVGNRGWTVTTLFEPIRVFTSKDTHSNYNPISQRIVSQFTSDIEFFYCAWLSLALFLNSSLLLSKSKHKDIHVILPKSCLAYPSIGKQQQHLPPTVQKNIMLLYHRILVSVSPKVHLSWNFNSNKHYQPILTTLQEYHNSHFPLPVLSRLGPDNFKKSRSFPQSLPSASLQHLRDNDPFKIADKISNEWANQPIKILSCISNNTDETTSRQEVQWLDVSISIYSKQKPKSESQHLCQLKFLPKQLHIEVACDTKARESARICYELQCLASAIDILSECVEIKPLHIIYQDKKLVSLIHKDSKFFLFNESSVDKSEHLDVLILQKILNTNQCHISSSSLQQQNESKK